MISQQTNGSAIDRNSPFEAGRLAWAAIERHRLIPNPANFQVLFVHYCNSNSQLSERLDAHMSNGRPLSEELLKSLNSTFIGTNESLAEMEAVSSGADALTEAAHELAEKVASSQSGLHSYGSSLAHWAGRMNADATPEGLIQAVAALAAETARASERNRELERELSASAAQIGKLRQNLNDVRQQASTDELTGLSNRRAFDTRLRRAVKQAQGDANTTFCLLLIDIDHFKRFNDTHGHRAGDRVLRLVGQLLSDNLKGRDTAARYGGEEFAILLDGANVEAGRAVAAQLCEQLAQRRLIKRDTGQSIGQVTCSIGVAQYRSADDGSALVERADQALYEAKRTGRNRVCIASVC